MSRGPATGWRLLAGLAAFAAQGALAAGLAGAGRSAGALAALAGAGAWAAALLLRSRGGAGACLGATALLAVLSLVAGVPGTLPALAGAAGLVAWDLALLDLDLACGGPADGVRRLERAHLGALAAGLLPALGLELLLGQGRLEIPFWGMLALGAAAVAALGRAARRWGR